MKTNIKTTNKKLKGSLKKTVEFLKKLREKIKQYPQIQFILFGVLLAFLFLGPYYDFIPGGRESNFHLSSVLIYSVAALGLNLLLGFGGLISLATAGFMGLGALGIVFFIDDLGFPFELAALSVLVISTLLGAVVGWISLRVQGIYLAITTLFISEIMATVFTTLSSIFGNNSRGLASDNVTLFGFLSLSQDKPYTVANMVNYDRYLLLIILTVLLVSTMIVIYHVIKSKTGRAFMAMSRSSNAAQAMGINIVKYRLIAFMLANFFASLSGIMFMMWNQTSSNNRWTLMVSLTVIAIVVVGGLKSIFGTVLGALVIYAFPRVFLYDILGEFSYAFGGLMIILVILFYPKGIVYLGHDIKRLYHTISLKIKRVKTNG